MRKTLTAKTIEALKPSTKRYDVHDVLCPGLCVRVGKQAKIFTVKYRCGLKQRRLRLGVHPRISLAQAREKALEALRHVDEGIDPAARRRQLGTRVETVCEDFIRQHARPRNRSWKEAERILQRELVAAHGQRDIREIKRGDILELMDAAIERGSTYQANRILAHVRRFLNWSLERGIIDATPIAGLKSPTREQSRDRVLSDDEITAVLKGCAGDVYPYRQFAPMLLATAQRRGEVAGMTWRSIDLAAKTWVIPAERSKNGKPHVVPLSDFALGLLAEMPRFAGCDLVFTTTATSPISGFSKGIRRVHERSKTSEWRFHDLRRTAASGMAREGVAPHVIEKVLNHISGSISGVAAIYNRWSHNPEKRAALDAWGSILDQLTQHDS